MSSSAHHRSPDPTIHPPTLTALVARAAEGDADAWAAVTDRYTHAVWAVARSHQLSRDDSADVVRVTWLRLIESLRQIDRPEALPEWLAATARREALKLIRRRSSSDGYRTPTRVTS